MGGDRARSSGRGRSATGRDLGVVASFVALPVLAAFGLPLAMLFLPRRYDPAAERQRALVQAVFLAERIGRVAAVGDPPGPSWFDHAGIAMAERVDPWGGHWELWRTPSGEVWLGSNGPDRVASTDDIELVVPLRRD